MADGFEDCTFATPVSLIEKEHAAEKVRLVDPIHHCIMEDLLVPDVLPPHFTYIINNIDYNRLARDATMICIFCTPATPTRVLLKSKIRCGP